MAHLSLALLGSFQVTLDGQPVTTFKYDKVRALLAYLAVENTPHEREALLGLFWPELPQAAARNNLRQVLITLREAIGDRTAEPPFLLANRATVQWNPASNTSLDVAVFADLLAACARHPHRNRASCGACAARLAQAVTLYRGNFLAEFFLPDSEQFEEWALLKREWLRQSMFDALTQLIAYHERRGQYEQALEYARRQLALDTWREETHRQLMRLYVLNNERSAALAQYEACRRLLRQALDVEPEAETTALYRQIREARDELPLALAPLAAPSRRRHRLPPQPTPFIGRERELATIRRLLDEGETRLITFTGPGGIGKTRLALQAAMEQIDHFADGVYYVPLADLSDVALLPDAIAAALQIEVPATAAAGPYLLQYVSDLEALLVLDNVEQLLAAPASVAHGPREGVAVFLAKMLDVAPGITILATSRQRLNVRAEWVFAVAGLPVPQPETAPGAAESDAVQLFVQNAHRRAGFVLAPEQEPSVVNICQLVEGLPLALEIAATWTRILTPAEIVGEIEQGLDFFSTPLADVSERHRSLTAVFSYSWQALTGEEQRVLRQLSVFRGGFQREAAVEVAGAALPVLAALVDKSLLRYSQVGRYALHELIRQYAAEKLTGEEETPVRRRHAAYYLALAERSEPELKGAGQARWLERLESEVDNLRASLRWAIDTGEVVLAGRLCVALDHFWNYHGRLGEGKRWLEEILLGLQADDNARSALRARMLNSIGMIACEQGDYTQAIAAYEESLALQRALNDPPGIARVLNNLGNIFLRRSDSARALPLFEEALAIYRQLGDAWAIGTLLGNIGVLLCDGGNFDRGADFHRESLALRRQLGDAYGIAMSLYNLADVHHHQGNDAEARNYLQESLVIFRQLHHTLAIAMALHFSGKLSLWGGDAKAALADLRESLRIFRDLGAQHYLAAVLESLAATAGMRGETVQGARLLGAAEALRDEIGAVLNVAERDEYAHLVKLVQRDLDDVSFAAAREAGRSMGTGQAIALALDDRAM